MTETKTQIHTPLNEGVIQGLHAGDSVLLSGTVFTARDAAHERIIDALEAGDEAPFELSGQVIYYCGPAPRPPGKPIGAAGPTTSYRMDSFTPTLHARGLKGTIGKGDREESVRQACRQYTAVYFVATGGAGALLSECVRQAEVIAYPGLGPEAVRRLIVEDMPLIVGYDAHGGSVFPGDEAL